MSLLSPSASCHAATPLPGSRRNFFLGTDTPLTRGHAPIHPSSSATSTGDLTSRLIRVPGRAVTRAPRGESDLKNPHRIGPIRRAKGGRLATTVRPHRAGVRESPFGNALDPSNDTIARRIGRFAHCPGTVNRALASRALSNPGAALRRLCPSRGSSNQWPRFRSHQSRSTIHPSQSQNARRGMAMSRWKAGAVGDAGESYGRRKRPGAAFRAARRRVRYRARWRNA